GVLMTRFASRTPSPSHAPILSPFRRAGGAPRSRGTQRGGIAGRILDVRAHTAHGPAATPDAGTGGEAVYRTTISVAARGTRPRGAARGALAGLRAAPRIPPPHTSRS